MDLFHKLIELVDKNSDKIPEGDYLKCVILFRSCENK